MKSLGAQLYTVRSLLTSKDAIKQTIKAVKDIGYDSIQLFGPLSLIECCAKYAGELQLKIVGILVDINFCEENESDLFAVCKKYGISDIGISSAFEEVQDLEAYIQRVNLFAKKAHMQGFTFSYHNHGHEFIKLDSGEIPMFSFLEGFETKTVNFMPDTYWLHDGGCDVRYFLEKTRNRVRILHLKDMKRIAQGHTFTEIGNGNLYFKGIIKTARECGIKHFIVEQDICEGNPIESLRQSYKYIQKLMKEE